VHGDQRELAAKTVRRLTDAERDWFEQNPEVNQAMRRFIWWGAQQLTSDQQMQWDLVQTGWKEAFAAMAYYDAERTGSNPLAFLQKSALIGMREYMFRKRGPVELKEHAQNMFRLMCRAVPKLLQWDRTELPTAETIQDIATTSEMSVDVVKRTLTTLMITGEAISEETPDQQLQGRRIEDESGQISAEEALMYAQKLQQLRKTITELPDRQQLIINLAYFGGTDGEGLTDQQIADQLPQNVTRARIQQIRADAERKLRDLLRAKGWEE
jgi:RNA polymerase sigma factor (sigma-70 family)